VFFDHSPGTSYSDSRYTSIQGSCAAAACRSIDLCLFPATNLLASTFSQVLYGRCANKAVLCSSDHLDAFMQQFVVCIYLSEHQTNHFMLSESLTTLDIAWPLFQAVRSLVLCSYVIFLQRLRLGKAHQGSFGKEADRSGLDHSTLAHFQNSFFSPNISIL
jgi:hypothetical protein